MIVEADRKAALAYLELVAGAVHHHDPAAIFGTVTAAEEFFGQLRPESDEEFDAMSAILDTIAAAIQHAYLLLQSDQDARRPPPWS